MWGLGASADPSSQGSRTAGLESLRELWTFVDMGKCLAQQFLGCLTFCGCRNENAECAAEGRAGVSPKERRLCGFGNANFLFRVLSQCLLSKIGRPLGMKLKF